MNTRVAPAPVHRRGSRPRVQTPQNDLARAVRRQSLAWWVAANAVGLWLAALLLWPQLGDHVAPLTYGRWMPLHLNWQLYGWCALPLVGVLLQSGLPAGAPRATQWARAALWFWTAALALGGVSWLGGTTSGKLFLDWHGWARPLLPAAMAFLWCVLAGHASIRWRLFGALGGWAYLGLLAALAPVPWVLYWASGRSVYPSVNPHSGGATGASLLGSTLGVIGVIHLVPLLLRLPRRSRVRGDGWVGGAWLLSWLVCGYVAGGPASHHATRQSAGLAVVLLWIPMLCWSLGRYRWTAGARPWLQAAGAWWMLLVASGWLIFLPGLSERLKFTNALVGHAHLAMAGFVTSALLVVLNELQPERPLRQGFGWWQLGSLAQVAVLLVSGWFENEQAAAFFSRTGGFYAVEVIRTTAGALMLLGSVALWREELRS